VEKSAHKLPVEKTEEATQETVRILKTSTKPKYYLTKAERTAPGNLKENNQLTILPADKGNADVILNTEDYKHKVISLLEDTSYKKLGKDSTEKTERIPSLLLKTSSLTEDIKKQLLPSGSRPSKVIWATKKYTKWGHPETHCEQHWCSHLPITWLAFSTSSQENLHATLETAYSLCRHSIP
jgi:hypothetical protein